MKFHWYFMRNCVLPIIEVRVESEIKGSEKVTAIFTTIKN